MQNGNQNQIYAESDLMVDKASQNDAGKSCILLGHHVKYNLGCDDKTQNLISDEDDSILLKNKGYLLASIFPKKNL